MNVSTLMNAASYSFSDFSRAFSSSVSKYSALILLTSVTALGGLAAYHWTIANPDRDRDTTVRFKHIQEKVKQAYAYVFGGFAVTAVSAAILHATGLSRRILTNGALATFGLVITMGAALVTTLLTDKENTKIKHIAWGIFNVSMGALMSPLCYMQRSIVAQAAFISLSLGGILTFVAFKAPDEQFLKWEGPLMAALTALSVASCIAFFFPNTAFAYGVDRASLYGGLVIFCGLFMSSTQRLIHEAETQSDRKFDPINSSIHIYLDGINIFLRILRILAENQKKDEVPAG